MTGVSFKVTAETSQTDARLAEINKTLAQIKGSADGVSNSLTKAFRNITATVSLGAIAVMMKNITDNATSLENRMKTIASDAVGVAAAMRTVKELSMETRSAVGATAELYQRYSKAAETLAATSEDVLRVTRLTAQAIQLSGTSADSANAAVIQLGQGLGAGVLRGEELNSVLEQAPRLAQAIAQGLGVGVQQLRNMGQAGVLTSEAVFNSLLSQSDRLNEEFSRTTFTMAQNLTNLKTASSFFASEAMRGLISGGGVGQLISAFADKIYEKAETVQSTVSRFVGTIALHFSDIRQLASAVGNVAFALFRSFADAVPVISSSRMLVRDLYGIMVSLSQVVRETFRAPLAGFLSQLREANIYTNTFFGLFDFQIPAAMREAFNSKSIGEFTIALNKLAKGVDGNTNFILNRLSAIPRQLKYGLQDVAIYFGILDKPVTFRKGYFEPFLDSLGEIKEGLIVNYKWATSFGGSLTPIGQALTSIGNIFRNALYVLYVGAIALAGVVSGVVVVLDKLLQKAVVFAKAFSNNNTFEDVFKSTQSNLTGALRNVHDFADKVIYEFFHIWDAVIGHSWWTDTVETVISTSESLWDKSAAGLQRFGRNTENMFKSIYENRPVADMLENGRGAVVSGFSALQIKVSKVDFVDLGKRIVETFKEVFSNLKENYKDILETAGVGLLFMGLVALFPGTAFAQALSAKTLLAITAGLAIVSDRVANQITGGSPLGVIAATMGEVLGRELYRFITNIPQILNSAFNVVVGLFKGFVSQLPVIGGFLEGLINFPAGGNLLGLIGSILFGKSILSFLNFLGVIKTTPAAIALSFAKLFSVFSAVDKNGLVVRALFGSSLTAIIGGILLINGAFDGLLNGSTTLKVIAGGGLLMMFLKGMNSSDPAGLFAKTIFMGVWRAVDVATTGAAFLSGIWTRVGATIMSILSFLKNGAMFASIKALFTLPGSGAILSQWQVILLTMARYWNTFTTAMMASSFGSVVAAQLGKVAAAMGVLQVRMAAFAATGAGKWIIGGAIVGAAALYGSKANAAEVGPNGEPAPTQVSMKTSWVGEVWESIKSVMSDALDVVSSHALEIFLGFKALAAVFAAFTAQGSYLALVWAAAGKTIGGLLAGLVTALAALVGWPVLIAGALIGGAAALIGAFGVGNGFVEKLQNLPTQIKRFFGFSPKDLVPEGTKKVSGQFSDKAAGEAERLGMFNPKALDFSKVDFSRQSKSALKNEENFADKYNKALEKAASEFQDTGKVAAGTMNEVSDAAKRFELQLDKMSVASSSVDPKDAMSRLLEAVPRDKSLFEAPLDGFYASFTDRAVAMVSELTQGFTGYKTSLQAQSIGNNFERLEREKSMAEERRSNTSILSTPVQWFKAQEAVLEAKFNLAKYGDSVGKSGGSAEAFRASEKLRAIEDAQQATGFAKQFAGKDLTGYSPQLMGFVSAAAAAISGAEKNGNKERLEQISALTLEIQKQQVKASAPDRYFSERRTENVILSAYLDENTKKLLMLIEANEKDSKKISFDTEMKTLNDKAKSADYKISEESLLGMTSAERQAFGEKMNVIKMYSDEIAKAGSVEEKVALMRRRSAEQISGAAKEEIAALLSMKGERAALLELSKKTGTEELINKIKPRLTDDNSKRLKEEQDKLIELQSTFEDRVKSAKLDKANNLTEEEIRDKFTKEVVAQQKVVDDSLIGMMTPREKVLTQASLLGVTLGEQIMNSLGSSVGVERVSKELAKLQSQKENIDNLPANSPLRDAATVNLGKGVSAANKKFADGPKAKSLSELMSSVGVQFENLLTFGGNDYKQVTGAAKALEKVEEAISKLGPAASKSQVDSLIKKKMAALKDVAEIAAKYAYDTVDKVAGVFENMGLTTASMSPALQGTVMQLQLATDETKRLAKEERDVFKVAQYLETEKSLKRMKEYLADISLSSFGDKLDRINGQLKMSMSESMFADLDKGLQDKLNQFSIYYKQTMAAVRDGRLEGVAAQGALKTLEDGLRSAKFISIFEGWGRAVGDALQMSASSQYEKIKSNGFDLKFEKSTFEKFSPESRAQLTEQSVLTDMYRKILALPDASQKMLEIARDAFTGDVTNDKLNQGLKDIQAEISKSFPGTTLGEMLDKVAAPKHFTDLTAAVVGLTKAFLGDKAPTTVTAKAGRPRGQDNYEEATTGATSNGGFNPATGVSASQIRTDTERMIEKATNAGIDKGTKSVDGPDGIAAMLAKAGITQDASAIGNMSVDKQSRLRELASNKVFKDGRTTETGIEYDKAAQEIKDFLEDNLVDIKNYARDAGKSLANDTNSALLSGLQNTLRGKSGSEGGLNLETIVLGFAGQITDSFAKGMMKTVEGYTTAFFEDVGASVFKLGSSIFKDIAKQFSDPATAGNSSGGDGTLGTLMSVFNLGMSLFGGGGASFSGMGGDVSSGAAILARKATGGMISGPGTGTSDSILALLSNGEFIINAKESARHRALLHSINSGELSKYATGGVIGYDSGGAALTAAGEKKAAGNGTSVFNLNITGDVSRQTRTEIQRMIPNIATGVGLHNRELGGR